MRRPRAVVLLLAAAGVALGAATVDAARGQTYESFTAPRPLPEGDVLILAIQGGR